MSYIDELTPHDRLQAIKTGMVLGLTLESNNIEDMEKRGQNLINDISSGMRMALTAALLAGVPLGAAWHVMDRNSSARRQNERELHERLKFYKDISTGVEDELADQNQQTVTSI